MKYFFLFANTELDMQEISKSKYANLTVQNRCSWIQGNEDLFKGMEYLQRLNLFL